MWFVDWNRIVSELYENYILKVHKEQSGLVIGQTGSKGKSEGKVKIVHISALENNNYIFEHGDVLVCTMTSPDYVPLMKKASAIVTDQGGILSHAAIIARELNIPCIVGTGNATEALKDGDLVEVNADEGIVKKIEE